MTPILERPTRRPGQQPTRRWRLVVALTLALLVAAGVAVGAFVLPGLYADARDTVYEAVPGLDPHYSLDAERWNLDHLADAEVAEVEAAITAGHVELNQVIWSGDGDREAAAAHLADARDLVGEDRLASRIGDALDALDRGDDRSSARSAHGILHDIQGPAGMRE